MSIVALLIMMNAVSAAPLSDPQSWITSDDYPSPAIAGDAEGTVQARLMIDAAGRVSNCAIIESSGNQELDTKTCSLLQERAQFSPARDDAGAPVASLHTQNVRWNIPRDQLISRGFRMTQSVDASGRMTGCKLDSFGEDPGLECDPMMLKVTADAYLKRPTSNYESVSLLLAMQVDEDAQINLFRDKGEERAIVAQAQIRVSADGTITECASRHTGRLDGRTLDLCEGIIEVGAREFEPAPTGLERIATVTFEVSARLR